MLNVKITDYANQPSIVAAEESAKRLKIRTARIVELVNSGMSFSAAIKIARKEQGLN